MLCKSHLNTSLISHLTHLISPPPPPSTHLLRLLSTRPEASMATGLEGPPAHPRPPSRLVECGGGGSQFMVPAAWAREGGLGERSCWVGFLYREDLRPGGALASMLRGPIQLRSESCEVCRAVLVPKCVVADSHPRTPTRRGQWLSTCSQ